MKKNSILLVDFTNQLREQGRPTLRLSGLKAGACSGLTLSGASFPTLKGGAWAPSNVSAAQALLEACPIRLRPILMTSLSTIAAAVPPAMALGPGAETRIPMAVAVIGGVALSTLLTLFVVPCAYDVLCAIIPLRQQQGGRR